MDNCPDFVRRGCADGCDSAAYDSGGTMGEIRRMTRERQKIFNEWAYSRMMRGAKEEAEAPVRESARWHMGHRPYGKSQDVVRRDKTAK